jgi:predicted acylesterase/phospholipase RssA
LKRFTEISSGHARRIPLNRPIQLGVALQGGGSHGAYEAGVINALVDSKIFTSGAVNICAVAGTSAGAMNGAILTSHLNDTRYEMPKRLQNAADAMRRMWDDVGLGNRMISMANSFNVFSLSEKTLRFLLIGLGGADATAKWPNLSEQDIDMMHKTSSRLALAQLHRFLDQYAPNLGTDTGNGVALYVNAVKAKDPSQPFQRDNLEHVVFGSNPKKSHVVASAALRLLGPEYIDKVPHWDGAYLENPSYGGFDNHDIDDLLTIVIQKKPSETIQAVSQDEIATNWKHLPQDGVMTGEVYHHLAYLGKTHPSIRQHVIALDVQDDWGHTTRYNTDPKWLDELYRHGYNNGAAWAASHPFDKRHERGLIIDEPNLVQ